MRPRDPHGWFAPVQPPSGGLSRLHAEVDRRARRWLRRRRIAWAAGSAAAAAILVVALAPIRMPAEAVDADPLTVLADGLGHPLVALALDPGVVAEPVTIRDAPGRLVRVATRRADVVLYLPAADAP